MQKICLLCLFVFYLMLSAFAQTDCTQANRDYNYYKNSQKYEHIYMDPPRKSLATNGRYIMISSGVRYVHSPSKLKRAAHAARVDAYNYQAGNY